MKNFVTKGKVFEYLVAAAVSSGDLVEMGDVVGVAATDGEIGDTISVYVNGVFEVPKVAGAVTQGAKLYSDGEGNLTTTATDNLFAGHAYAAAQSGDATVLVKLNF